MRIQELLHSAFCVLRYKFCLLSRIACNLLVMVLALLLIAPAHAQRARNSDLDRIRNEIGRLRTRLATVRTQAQTAKQELEAVELELGIRTRELELAVAAEARLVDEQHQLESRIAQLLPRIAQRKEYLRQRLGALYRLGDMGYLRILLAMDREQHPIDAVSMLSYLISRDARTVTRFENEQRELSLRRSELADQKRRLIDTRRVVEDRKRAVTASVQQKERVLARLQSEESGSERQLAELEEKAKRLERLVEFLSRQQSGFAGTIDVRTVQGALPWPVEGTIVEGYGLQRNPKFATVTTSHGVKIRAVTGTAVRSVFQGTVLFSQWFKGYGNLIILDHGNRVFSLYGNLKAPSVTVSERINAGQVIAGVGESEDGRAGYLYFEVRRDNRPEDPQKWLR